MWAKQSTSNPNVAGPALFARDVVLLLEVQHPVVQSLLLLLTAPAVVMLPCLDFGFVFAAKKSVNVGKGGRTAGLDDYIYDAADDDDFDFM